MAGIPIACICGVSIGIISRRIAATFFVSVAYQDLKHVRFVETPVDDVGIFRLEHSGGSAKAPTVWRRVATDDDGGYLMHASFRIFHTDTGDHGDTVVRNT